jgi:hypothetical protein
MQHLRQILPVLAALTAASVACKRETPPAAQEPRAPSAVGALAAQPDAVGAAAPALAEGTNSAAAAQPAAGQPKYTEPSFELSFRPSGSYAAGQEGAVEIVLDAKPPFHVNTQYPYKFKVKEGPGVKYPKPVVTKDAAKMETQRVTMPVAFVPEAAGNHTVSGQFAFSVCTDETCLMEKRDLTLVVAVK